MENKTTLNDTAKTKYGESLFNFIKSKDRNPNYYTKMNFTMNLGVCI